MLAAVRNPLRTALAHPALQLSVRRASGRASAQGLEFLQNRNADWTESQREVREGIANLAKPYDDAYWRNADKNARYPQELVDDLAAGGWLGICMPTEYGGSGLGIAEASVMLQTLAETGGCLSAVSAVHTSVFSLEPVVHFASAEQKQRWIPPLVAGKERCCFGVTEPNAGLNTLAMETNAVKSGDKYIVNGRKMWITTAQRAEKILLLCRTTPLKDVKTKTGGLSLFYTTLDRSKVEVKEIEKMGRSAIDTNMMFFDNWEIPAEDLVGVEGEGFKQMMVGMNAERVLVAAENVGIGFAALRKASQYATERVVFGREIGMNQGVQHPLADAWMNLEAARILTYTAAKLYDDGAEMGAQANAAKYLAARAAFTACERSITTHGGVGYAKEYDVERYLREIIISRIAPVSEQMILNYIGERVLGQKKSY